jgi:hypothetical protein
VELLEERVEERGEAPDGGGAEDAPGAEDPPRFAERGQAIGPLGQVVEGAEEEDGVGAGVGVVQAAGVAHGQRRDGVVGLAGRGAAGLLDVERHGVDQVHRVASGGQPARVDAGAAADVEHHRRRRGQVPGEQLLRARALELVLPGGQPPGLQPQLVVLLDLSGEALSQLEDSPLPPWGSGAG